MNNKIKIENFHSNFKIYENKENIIPNRNKLSKKKQSKEAVSYYGQNYQIIKRIASQNASRLKHILNLKQSKRWPFYEWFYSNIDRPILLGNNYFNNFLDAHFPNLKTRILNREHWRIIRRLLGKLSRRCSVNYYNEERQQLNQQRQLIRRLQQRTPVEPRLFNTLPDDFNVPMSLIIGTEVLAKISLKLEVGKVHGVKGIDNSYVILFENQRNGTQLVHDYNVLSVHPQTVIPISTFKTDHKTSRRLFNPIMRFKEEPFVKIENTLKIEEINSIANCVLCSSETVPGSENLNMDEISRNVNHHGGFPIKLLVMTTKLAKLIQVKNEYIEDMRTLNDRAQMMKAIEQQTSPEFQFKYQCTVLMLEKINAQISEYLAHTVQFVNKIAEENGFDTIEQPSDVKQDCDILAFEMINKVRNVNNYDRCSSGNFLFISKAISSLCQIRTLTERSDCEYDLLSVRKTISEMKENISPVNIEIFTDAVQVPINTIVSDMDRKSNLTSLHYFHPTLSRFT